MSRDDNVMKLFWIWTFVVAVISYGGAVFWNDPLELRPMYLKIAGKKTETITTDGWNMTANGTRWRLEPDQPECPTAKLSPEDEALVRKYLPKTTN